MILHFGEEARLGLTLPTFHADICLNNKYVGNLTTPHSFLANMRRRPNVGLLLGQRRRQWANSKPTLNHSLMIAV